MVAVSESSPPGAQAALADSGLGLGGVLSAAGAAIAPAVVVAGLISTGYQVTGVAAIPVALLVVAVVIGLFCPAYLAMSQRIRNAGAFYAYIAHACRPAGVGAAFIALPAYAALSIGTYGAIGVVGAGILADLVGVGLSWWLVALAAWFLVALLGALRVTISARFLATALLAEVVVVTIADVVNLAHPHGGGLSWAAWNPTGLSGQWGPALAIAATAFIGVESAAVFTEESRSPATISRATGIALAAAFAVYALSGWAMATTVRPGGLHKAAGTYGPDLPFALAAQHLDSGLIVDVGRLLFVTSLIAAALAYHNAVSRYTYALGREQVLPAWLGRLNPATSAPVHASTVQSMIALLVITGYAITGADPLLELFFRFGTIGGLGILTLLAATSLAAIIALRGTGTPARVRLFYPALATAGLATIIWIIIDNLSMLLDVPIGDRLTWAIPAGYLTLAVVGAAWGLTLRRHRPDVYSRIGSGADTSSASYMPAHADARRLEVAR